MEMQNLQIPLLCLCSIALTSTSLAASQTTISTSNKDICTRSRNLILGLCNGVIYWEKEDLQYALRNNDGFAPLGSWWFSVHDMEDVDLSSIEIKGPIEGKGFTSFSFRYSVFHKASLYGHASDKKLIFHRCDFTGADFSEANLRYVEFIDCVFREANFSEASLANVEFENCTFEGVFFPNRELRSVKFKNCLHVNATLEKAKLAKIGFIGTPPREADFPQADPSAAPKDCIFCKIIAGEDPSEVKIAETADLLVVEDRYPKTKIHYLILPKEHIINVKAMENRHRELAGNMILMARQLAEKLGEELGGPPPDFKLVVTNGPRACQAIYHLHMHFLSNLSELVAEI